MDRILIEAYAVGGEAFKRSIQGLSREDFQAVPVAGTWSIGQIALHLMDSDLIASDRMKRVIAEDQPTIIGYNETLFAQKLFYDELDPFAAAEIFDLNRRMTAEILRRLPAETYARWGMHNEAGKVTLEYLVKHYVEHLEHHLKFVVKKRALLGKPL